MWCENVESYDFDCVSVVHTSNRPHSHQGRFGPPLPAPFRAHFLLTRRRVDVGRARQGTSVTTWSSSHFKDFGFFVSGFQNSLTMQTSRFTERARQRFAGRVRLVGRSQVAGTVARKNTHFMGNLCLGRAGFANASPKLTLKLLGKKVKIFVFFKP